MNQDDNLLIEAQEIIDKIASGEIETVVLSVDEEGRTLTTTPEVMDLLLEDPDEAAEIMEQVQEFLRTLPEDDA